jgi:hypothetical protein
MVTAKRAAAAALLGGLAAVTWGMAPAAAADGTDGTRVTSVVDAGTDGTRITGAGTDGTRVTGAGTDGTRVTGAGTDGTRVTSAPDHRDR